MKQRLLAVLAATATLGAGGAMAQEAIGTYLAARQASFVNDYEAAAEYFSRALTEDPSNPVILESTVVAQVSLGRIDLAIPVAQKMEADGLTSQIAHMPLLAADVKEGRLEEVLARIADQRGISPLADGLIVAWAQLGTGDMRAAVKSFDTMADEPGVRAFASYHKALAFASVGDFESAEKLFSGEANGPMQTTRRGTIAWAEVLSQLERNEDAVAVIDEAFSANMDPEILMLREQLASGATVPFSLIKSSTEGIAEVFYSLGRALASEAGEEYVLLYARLAEYLSPENVDAIMMTAEVLEAIGRYELATEAFKRVPRDHPAFASSELGRAESLRRAEKTDAAVEVLEQLAKTHPELPLVHVSAGDLYRQLERFDEAASSYDEALEIYEEQGQEQWFVHYARAISRERIGDWDRAEADFRRALELNPEHPQVLNYLGYSLVEKKIKLDEALDMIERAVAAQPNSGYIVDSLGWVLYRLGRYDEAIGHMERAAELMPVDPVVNDHLGDVLWAVGRFTEAEFQWKRALSFVDEDDHSPDIDPDRIRRKLEVGLDEVLAEEGAPPLKVADDGG